jgi:hypothetical protein
MNMVTIYICAFRPGTVGTRSELHDLVAQVAAEFGLSGRIE